ncbi:hypothetical protein [Pseudomonas migulae]|nr:hypothetical protein [uncultured Pseudomonas sp.]
MTSKKPRVFEATPNEKKLDSSSIYEYPGDDAFNKFALEFVRANNHKSATIKETQRRLRMFFEFVKIYQKRE